MPVKANRLLRLADFLSDMVSGKELLVIALALAVPLLLAWML